MKKTCNHPKQPCDCHQLNELSMTIAQDIWDSCAKHLGPDCGLTSDKVFSVTAVALTAFIEEMAATGRDDKGNPITISDVLDLIYAFHMDAKEYLNSKHL